MSLTLNDDFTRASWDLIASQSPLVLDVTLQNTNTSASSGDVTVEIQGEVNADNTTLYTFDLGYVGTTGSGPNYDHAFKLDITDIIRKICNDPLLQDDTTAGFETENRMATRIAGEVKSSGETPTGFVKYFAHGFNQVNNPDSSCLVDYADLATEAIVPIVPGSPMMFWLWMNANYGSIDLEVKLLKGAVQLWAGNIAAASVRGMYQFYYPTGVNDELYDHSDDKPEEFTLKLYDNFAPTDYQIITLIAFKKTCEGDVVLAWLNRFGTYSYMAFERFPTHRGEQKHIGSFDLEVYDIADLQSRTKSRGYTGVQKVISAVAKSVPTEYFDAIEDLFYSMDVYYFTGTLPEY